MNRLYGFLSGYVLVRQDTDGNDGDGGGGGADSAPTATVDTASQDGAGGTDGQGGDAGASNAEKTTPSGDGREAKPFLGGEKPKGPDGNGAGGDKPKNDGTASEADYLNALVKDEKLLGTDKELQLSQELLKAVVPEAQKLGVSPSQLNALANALAKAQIDEARTEMQNRLSYFERMKEASLKRYSEQDFVQINAGIDKWFKPGGVMNQVIRNSELGADPEFLALMHFLGKAAKEDGVAGAGAGGGGSMMDPNSTEGLSKLW